MSLMPAGLSGLPVLMGASPGVVRLLVGGMLYEGFEEVSVSRSLKEMAGQFHLVVAQETSPGRDGPSMLLKRPIREGDPCQIFYGSVLVLTGYVDVVNPDYDKKSHKVSIQGRSKTGDLCDSSVDDEIPGGEMRNVDLKQVADKATKRFGVKTKLEAKLKGPFDQVRNLPGERVHRFLERYARPGGVALTDDQMGDLRLFQAENGAPVTALIEGVNIEKASATLRSDRRHSEVHAKGQDVGTDQEYGKKVAQRRARALDPAVKRHRPLTIVNETKSRQQDVQNRADWEAANRAGESVSASVEVLDWCFAPGALWMPGLNVRLTSPMLYINRVLTVMTVSLSQKRAGGTMASLTLQPPEACNPTAGGGGGGDGNDSSWSQTRGGQAEEYHSR